MTEKLLRNVASEKERPVSCTTLISYFGFGNFLVNLTSDWLERLVIKCTPSTVKHL